MRNHKAIWCAMMLTVVATGITGALAQSEPEGRRAGRIQSGGPSEPVKVIAWQGTHAYLAKLLSMDNEVQLAISRFASDRADDDAVRDLAEDLMDSHREFLEKLGSLMTSIKPEIRVRRAASLEAAEPAPSSTDRQRNRGTAADEVREKKETRAVPETKSAAGGTGRETGWTGTRARDVRQGELGSDDSRTIAEPISRQPRSVESGGPSGVGAKGRTGVTGTTADEMRARDRRLDAFDRVGSSPVTEENRSEEAPVDRRTRRRVAERIGVGPSVPVAVTPTDADLALDAVGLERAKLIQRELGRLDGEAFDAAFLRYELIAHLNSLSLLRGLHGYVPSDLDELVVQAEIANQSHLSRVRKLLRQLEESAIEKTASRSE